MAPAHRDPTRRDRTPRDRPRPDARGRTLLVGVALCATALLGACTVDLPAPGGSAGTTPIGLVRAGSCGELRSRVAVTGRSGTWALEDRTEDGVASAGALNRAPVTGAAPSTATAAGEVVAGTNVQEVGVDESDLVATDGRRIVAVTDGLLRVVELDGTPAVDGRLDLTAAGATEVLLDGDRALVVGENGEVTLTLVDLVADGGPRVLRQRSVEGTLAAVRRHDGTTRVVVRSWPTPEVPMPLAEGRPLGRCADVLVPAGTPADTAGAGTGPGVAPDVAPLGRTTVLTPDAGLEDLRPVTVAAPADAVYASPTTLFVAGTTWDSASVRTAVHRFDLTGDGPARYTGSGSAEGSLLDRYSLSEDRGDLRVVTTVQPTGPTPMAGGDDPRDGPTVTEAVPVSRGRLTVLRPGGDGTLVEVGRLDGLGPNESVQAVRFMGGRAYVVTFRRTDPLFALDLSDPTAPRVLGELKVPGFSEYLHPVGDGLLMGVGSDADPATGVVTGAKVSLFDVRDPASPRELDTLVVPDARSEVADEARAFTWDPVHGQAVVPLERWGAAPRGGPVADPGPAVGPGPAVDGDRWAAVLGVEEDRLVARGELRHAVGGAGTTATIRRSVVVDDDLWTVSSAGLGRTDARTPTTLTLLPWE